MKSADENANGVLSPSPDKAGLALKQDLTAAVSTLRVVTKAAANPGEPPQVDFPQDWFDVAAERKKAAVPVAENETAALIRRAFQTAAGMSLEDMATLASAETTPKMDALADQSLALFWLAWVPPMADDGKRFPDRNREMRMLLDPSLGLKPAELAESMHQTVPLGYSILVKWENVTRVTSQVTNDEARGMVAFHVPDCVAGQVQYIARRKEGRWEITEFALPAHGIRLSRAPTGGWSRRE